MSTGCDGIEITFGAALFREPPFIEAP